MALGMRLKAECDFKDRSIDVVLDMERNSSDGPYMFAVAHPHWSLDLQAAGVATSHDLNGWRLPDGKDNRTLCPAHNPGRAR